MRSTKLLLLSLFLIPLSIRAEVLPCMPCAGVRFEPVQSVPISAAEPLDRLPVVDVQAAPAQPAVPGNPAEFVPLLKQAKLEKGSPLFVAWEVPLDSIGGGANPGDTAREIVEAGGTPWISLVFRTPAPVAQNAERLQTELRAAVAIASSSPAQAWFQIVWRPEGQESQPVSAAEYAFLIKRAAVTLTGARADARVASDALPADPKFLEAFYGEEVTAYVDAVALRPADPADIDALAAAATAVENLDPGRPVVLDAQSELSTAFSTFARELAGLRTAQSRQKERSGSVFGLLTPRRA